MQLLKLNDAASRSRESLCAVRWLRALPIHLMTAAPVCCGAYKIHTDMPDRKSAAQSAANAAAATDKPLYAVRTSRIHGRGVFAARNIPEDTCIIEYHGKRITDDEASERGSSDPNNPFHTFFFSLEDGKLIDGGDNGNDARWINHACEPNCEAREEDGRVFIHALRDIKRGEELNYDYGLIIEGRHTKKLKASYACHCGAKTCRGTMLAPKRR